MALAQLFRSKPQSLHGTGAKILHQHVGLAREPGHDFAPRIVLDIERERTFAAVRRDEKRGKLVGLANGSAAAAGDVAADRLDLEDVGALIGEKHGRERPRHHAGQVQHANA